jgi:predicted transcriptional regulator
MFGFFNAVKREYEKLNKARELTKAFDGLRMNFMQLDPVLRNALLKEAMATGTETTMETYTKAVEALAESGEPEEKIPRILVKTYAERAKHFPRPLRK